MQNARLDESLAKIKIAGRNISHLRYADDTTLMAESEEELKSLLMKMKEEREKAGLKLNIQKTKIMASCSITSWQITGKKWKQWQILFSWAQKSLWIFLKIEIFIKKQRYRFADKGPYSQNFFFFIFIIVMYRYVFDYKEG